ncbi:MAG TPA: ABC transporter ATP-binding protein [Roseiflexaceae bacterium]|nr:ABC transporter ATP-binding protein [Roseiflexaceae bacterium]
MITVEHVSYTYPGGSAPAVDDINFAIAPGEIFGFLGPSGAGKSTIQKILIGLLKGYRGHITVIGKPLDTWGSELYEHIGVSFELPNHFLKLTALENLAYFGALYRQPAQPRDLLEMVGLAEDAQTPVGQFSKGMKNRLNLARALLPNPGLLFLDEPTSGLDPVNARRIKDLIAAQRAAGRTVVLTTHNMAIAEELCDRVAFLVDGRIQLIDTPRALKLQHGAPAVRVEYQANSHLAREEFAMAGLGDNTAFLELLRQGKVQTIHTQEATLDEIFIRVTGRRLEV